jgi:hypothetical protein
VKSPEYEMLARALQAIHWRLDTIGKELRAIREAQEDERQARLDQKLRSIVKASPR